MTKGESLVVSFFAMCMVHKNDSYTSLGSTFNTFRNPALRLPSCETCSPRCMGEDTPLRASDETPTLASMLLKTANQAPPDDILGPSISHDGIPDGLVPLKLNSVEMCMADSGECSMECTPAATPEVDPACTHDERYRPAYDLIDGGLERAGRASSSIVTGLGELSLKG